MIVALPSIYVKLQDCALYVKSELLQEVREYILIAICGLEQENECKKIKESVN